MLDLQNSYIYKKTIVSYFEFLKKLMKLKVLYLRQERLINILKTKMCKCYY